MDSPVLPRPADAPPDASPDARLAAALLAAGTCDARTLDRATRVAAETGRRLPAVLLQLGLATERDLARTYAALLGLPLATPGLYPAEPVLSGALPPRFLHDARILPLDDDGHTILLAAADPLDPFVPAAVAAATGRTVTLAVALPVELEAALDRLYPTGDTPPEEAPRTSEEDAERLKDLASEAPVIRLVNGIISRAVETHASDIHVEPFESALRVRCRYDGVLHEVESPPAHLAPAITSRIKIMARLDIAERRLPQDGRIKLAVRGTEVDFRVSTVPSLYGETVVLRILDRQAVSLDYGTLGLPAPVVARFSAALDGPNGIVLVTGPTGSGKTTTLYTGLSALDSTARKVVTVEDPVEYQLAGINQIAVKPQIGLTFAHLLRSILRQDPDVIMVGEIRDAETVQVAVQAALTGHLVLSTIHTNSAAATVTRLRDMGLEDYLSAAVLRGILAQRLVRRLCPACRRPAPAPDELSARLDLPRRARTPGPITPGPITLWHPVGCPDCRGTGFRGRQAIAEFLEPTPAIERLIFARAPQDQIERAAVDAGMVTMWDAGLDAALAGVTTVEEVVRSVRADG